MVPCVTGHAGARCMQAWVTSVNKRRRDIYLMTSREYRAWRLNMRLNGTTTMQNSTSIRGLNCNPNSTELKLQQLLLRTHEILHLETFRHIKRYHKLAKCGVSNVHHVPFLLIFSFFSYLDFKWSWLAFNRHSSKQAVSLIKIWQTQIMTTALI